MKLFISYRRAAWSFTGWLAEELGKLLAAEIFVDYSSIDNANFETSLLTNLHESDAVLLIVTEQTFASDRIHNDEDWVHREIREAIALEKPIVLACQNGLMPPADLPNDIQEVRKAQGIEFYQRYFKMGVNELAALIDRATPIKLAQPVSIAPAMPTTKTADRTDRALFNQATTLAEAGQYDEAITRLEQLKQRGYKPRVGNLDDWWADVTGARDAEQRRWEAGETYDEIAALARVNVERAKKAWARFQTDYPDYTDDPAQLNLKLGNAQLFPIAKKLDLTNIQPISGTAKKLSSLEILPPPFAWIDIPAGKVTLKEGGYTPQGGKTFDVRAFTIARYPTTNAQFEKFIEADGYDQRKWWTGEGWQVKVENQWTEPRFWQDSEWNGADYPVVGISWHEAIAFCLWLNETTDENISLPTEQQWQLAAQGNTNRAYPWGDKFDKNLCNFNTARTTPVTQYEGKSASPFGVVDMSGNVLEWCLTAFATGSERFGGTSDRVLRGGSWDSDNVLALRVDYRSRFTPDSRYDNGGFRIARS
jgi:hypothetical protein